MTTPCCSGMRVGEALRPPRRWPAAPGSCEFAHCFVQRRELALDVAVPPGQVAQADGVDVDGVEVGEHVDEVLAGRPTQRSTGSSVGLLGAVEDDTVDVAHDVERRAVDATGRCTARACGAPGTSVWPTARDDAVLAGHVVGRLEHVAERRPTQHDLGAVGVGDRVRQVRATAADQLERERRARRPRRWPAARPRPGRRRSRRTTSMVTLGNVAEPVPAGRRWGGQPGRPTPMTLPQLTRGDLHASSRCSGRAPAGRRRGRC